MPFDIESTRIVTLPAGTATIKQLAAMSHDGHLIAYVSLDQDGHLALFLQNASNGQNSHINAPAGASALGIPVFSKNDKQLFFVANIDAENKQYLYSYDMQTGSTQLVSSDESGKISVSTLGYNNDYSISADGRYLVFVTQENRPALGDSNGIDDVYVKDLISGKLQVVSSNGSGFIGNNKSFAPSISNDGKQVLFQSLATNLNKLANDNVDHIYVKNLLDGSLQLIDVDGQYNAIGVSPYPYPAAIFSGNGSKVIFSNSDDTKSYIRNLNENSAFSAGSYLPFYFEDVYPIAISDDGRYFTFSSGSDTLGQFADDPYDSSNDLYRIDFQTRIIQFLTPHSHRKPYYTNVSFYGQSEDFQSILIATRSPSIFGGLPEIYRGKNVLSPYTLYVTHMLGLENNQGDDSLYGSSAADQLVGGNGDDTYWINNPEDVIVENIAGGQDTVLSVIANYTLPGNVENLALGSRSYNSKVIPYEINGSGNDMNNRITGNEESNVLKGFGGDDVIDGGSGNRNRLQASYDVIDGGSGFDIVIYPHLDYAKLVVKKMVDGIQVQRYSPYAGYDLLQNVERIQFNDAALALPGDTHAAQAYRIYQAAFNRTPDSVGLGFWVKQIDHGAKLTDIAHGFMQSDEFKGLYGEHPSNGAMVEKFYQNVLHRTPDAGGLAFWSDVLNSGRGTPEYVLAQFSESPENQAALTGVMDAGFTFTLYK